MTNKLYIGFSKQIGIPATGLFINDEIPKIENAKIFDIEKHSFNPLRSITYQHARELSDVLYTIYPQADTTLTVRNGRRALLPLLLHGERLDKIDTDNQEVKDMLADLLISPTLNRILCNQGQQFSFKTNALTLAKLNRAQLGDFDALILGLFLISQFKGQLIIPDFGFYGRGPHVNLIRQRRLIAGLYTLEELPENLRQHALLIEDKTGSGTTYDDAVTLARYAKLVPNTNQYNEFIQDTMA